MPIDAMFLRALVEELQPALVGARVDKVHQPERDEVVLALRGNGGNRKLLLSVGVGAARLHLTSEPRDNPASPPMFCMLLRKYIGNGAIRGLGQVPSERILVIDIDATNELGEPRALKLMLELIATQPNLILMDEDGRIVDCLRRIDGDIAAGKRQVLPGLFYRAPDPQDKIDPLQVTDEVLIEAITAAPDGVPCERWLTRTFAGLSPLTAREVTHRAVGNFAADMDDMTRQRLCEVFPAIVRTVREGSAVPTMVRRDGEPFDFSWLEILQYGDQTDCVKFGGFSELLERYYATRGHAERMRRRSREMSKTVKSAYERVSRRLETQKLELDEARDRERLRELGDLLMANLQNVGRGATSVTVVDFYSEEGGDAVIKLDNRLTPQQNAAKYYKDYTRRKNAEKILVGLIAAGEDERRYLASVMSELDGAENEKELEGIREELVTVGYLKAHGGKGKKKPEPFVPRVFMSSGGFEILVGRNNLQNDRLTLREAHKNDVWLHAKNAHGAHVLIRCGQEEPDDATYTEAGIIAAYHSNARDGASVAVDYTRARYVKKPAGARPGMVIYDPYFTMYSTPDAQLCDRLRVTNNR